MTSHDRLHVSTHPAVLHKLAVLRDERLEIAIGDDGSVVTRMVAGATR